MELSKPPVTFQREMEFPKCLGDPKVLESRDSLGGPEDTETPTGSRTSRQIPAGWERP